jgi:tRNA threonylcarbamoyladenosine biosynthesis protein TsaE
MVLTHPGTPAGAVEIAVPDPAAMTAFGEWLARLVGAGDTILLEGQLGAGKTHLARSVIAARLADAGLAEDIPSPTFTLVQTYEAGSLTILHADLYRLGHADEIAELGLADAFGSALCLIEWPGRLGPWTPPGALTIRIDDSDGTGRRLLLSGSGARWAAILAQAAGRGGAG